jgi:hypothetical protein
VENILGITNICQRIFKKEQDSLIFRQFLFKCITYEVKAKVRFNVHLTLFSFSALILNGTFSYDVFVSKL